ncbi:TB2/DP1, HVA22 family-domain-containing protein [Umbelopsis sp. PMI_123]|nr:TB2/DP1, HVA22 family-domain-containing protein [Umbelopsis sp. PMI_123]
MAINLESLQVKAKQQLKDLDIELSKYKFLNDIEAKTKVQKTHIALGGASILFIMVFFNLAGGLITNTIGWLYPAYASFKAIETPGKDDDTQWLTYWTVFGFVQTIEYFADILLYWFPFWYTFKVLLFLWLALPQFRGAEFLYNRFLRPVLIRAQPNIDSKLHNASAEVSSVFNGAKQD